MPENEYQMQGVLAVPGTGSAYCATSVYWSGYNRLKTHEKKSLPGSGSRLKRVRSTMAFVALCGLVIGIPLAVYFARNATITEAG